MNPHFIECGFNCIQDRFLGGIFLELEQHYPKLVNKIIVKFYGDPENHRGQIENHSDGTYTIRVNKDFKKRITGNRYLSPYPTKYNMSCKDWSSVLKGVDSLMSGEQYANISINF